MLNKFRGLSEYRCLNFSEKETQFLFKVFFFGWTQAQVLHKIKDGREEKI